MFSWKLEVGVTGVEKRDKRQSKDVKGVAGDLDLLLCYICYWSKLLCTADVQLCSSNTFKNVYVGFLFNACVYVTTCAYKYGVQISGSRRHKMKRKGEAHKQHGNSCWLDFLAFGFTTASCLSLIIDILCVLHPLFHIFK